MNLGYIATTIDSNSVVISYEVSSYIINSYNFVTMNELTNMAYTTALSSGDMDTLFPLSAAQEKRNIFLGK